MFCVLLSSVAFSQYLLSMSHLCQVRHCSECALIPHAMTARLEVRCQTTRKHKTTSGIKCWNSSRCRKPAQCFNMIWTIVSYAGWHTGNNFDEDPHEDLGRPQNFCGAHQARSIPDAKLNSLKLSQWRTSLVVVFLCGRPTLFLRASFFTHFVKSCAGPVCWLELRVLRLNYIDSPPETVHPCLSALTCAHSSW